MQETNRPDTDTGVHSQQRWLWFTRWQYRHLIVIALLGGAFGLAATGVMLVSNQTYLWPRLTVMSVLFFFLSTALAEKVFEARIKQQPWNTLAQRTGLSHQSGHFWLGGAERVTGMYRGYALTLYTARIARGHMPATRIELVLPRMYTGLFRLRGPYEPAEIMSEAAFNQVFGGGSLYHIGYERFFIRSRPAWLSRALFGTDGWHHGPLRYQLLKLKRMTNIELDGHRLHLEEFGALLDVDYLHLLFDLLCDMADAIENVYASAQMAEDIEQAA